MEVRELRAESAVTHLQVPGLINVDFGNICVPCVAARDA
jgi:hypothetical protein